MDNQTAGLVEFVQKLDSIEIPYLIGGSLAAGIWGNSRKTNDVDVEVWLEHVSISHIFESLKSRYMCSFQEIQDAMTATYEFGNFQVFDIERSLKYDCFVQGRFKMDKEALERAQIVKMGNYDVQFACAERILVQKLRWYTLGNRMSERQWRDIEGIAKTPKNFNWSLAIRWSIEVDLEDLCISIRDHAR